MYQDTCWLTELEEMHNFIIESLRLEGTPGDHLDQTPAQAGPNSCGFFIIFIYFSFKKYSHQTDRMAFIDEKKNP